jgi:uncharacterized SAM-binding protein YcdF (DUF218 family)
MTRLLGAALLTLLAQLAAYAFLLLRPPLPEPGRRYDLLAVFGGDPERARLGLSLARQGRAAAFVVSDAGQEELGRFFTRYGGPGQARVLLEPYARTTDQNARLVARLAGREAARSVLLVTSWIHGPRAYLLLRLGLMGTGVRVALQPAGSRPRGKALASQFAVEAGKFWGSLARWAKSGLRGAGFMPWENLRKVD